MLVRKSKLCCGMRSLLPIFAFVLCCAPPAYAKTVDIKQQHMRPEQALCMQRRLGEFVKTWLALVPGSAEERKLVRRTEPGFSLCFMSFPNAYSSVYQHASIRKVLVRELLRPALASLPEQPPAGLAKADWYRIENVEDPGAAPALIANALGFCLARTDWPATRAFVRAEPGSPEAKAGLARLVPHIAGCIPAGQKLTLDGDRLHTIMTETVFHAVSSEAP